MWLHSWPCVWSRLKSQSHFPKSLGRAQIPSKPLWAPPGPLTCIDLIKLQLPAEVQGRETLRNSGRLPPPSTTFPGPGSQPQEGHPHLRDRWHGPGRGWDEGQSWLLRAVLPVPQEEIQVPPLVPQGSWLGGVGLNMPGRDPHNVTHSKQAKFMEIHPGPRVGCENAPEAGKGAVTGSLCSSEDHGSQNWRRWVSAETTRAAPLSQGCGRPSRSRCRRSGP